MESYPFLLYKWLLMMTRVFIFFIEVFYYGWRRLYILYFQRVVRCYPQFILVTLLCLLFLASNSHLNKRLTHQTVNLTNKKTAFVKGINIEAFELKCNPKRKSNHLKRMDYFVLLLWFFRLISITFLFKFLQILFKVCDISVLQN